MRVPRLSPLAYRRITIVAALLLATIIVTGAAVRLTQSGLGCPVGISCPKSRLEHFGPASEHATIEHVNRLFTGLVGVIVIVAVLGSLVRAPRRRDLTWLSVGLVVGVLAQAVLGQLTVQYDLKPPFVMAHFLLSILLLSDAIVLAWRAGQPNTRGRALVTRPTVALARVLIALAAAVLVTGTVVTGAGPHSGGTSKQNVARIDIPIVDAARVHSTTVIAFLVAVLVMLWLLRRDRAPQSVMARLSALLVILVAQGVLGYVQYFNDIPALLVGFHVAGATLVWSATLLLYLALFEHPAPARARDDQASAAVLAPA